MAVVRLGQLCLALVLIFGGRVCAQNAATSWFPVQVGDKWIYEHETRDDTGEGPAHLEIHRWKTEETIIGSWTVPQGTLVGREVRIAEGSPGYAWQPNPAYLIRGDCLYRLGARDRELAAHQLTPDFLKSLGAGEISADFCFPLVAHKTWGAPNWGGKDWEVAERKLGDPSAPGKQNPTFHITSVSSYPGSGMTADIWLERGVGITREEEIHHGTIGEERTRLLRFEPASQR